MFNRTPHPYGDWWAFRRDVAGRKGISMYGADADALAVTARRFVRSSHELRRHRSQLSSLLSTAAWVGDDAAASRSDWNTIGSPAMLRTSAFMETLGETLLEHAAAQRGASDREPGGISLGVVDDVIDRVKDAIDDWFDDLFGGDVEPVPQGAPAVDGLRPSTFGAPADARDAVLMAMNGLGDAERIARDEIEIRALDNGRYIVVLPGVTDLSDGFDQFIDRIREDGPLGVPRAGRETVDAWADNDEPTVRKMRYAYEAALRDDTTENEYSTVTIAALQAAGVPAGADVMIIGHSFGAYTAMDLAANPSFNSAAGDASEGYHLTVTHVIAAGAETDWRFDEVPAATETLVLNNRVDLVYRTEDVLHSDGDALHPGHLELNFWGGIDGYGHDEQNYIDWIAKTGQRGLASWLGGVGDDYSSGGTRVSAQVPDPNL